MASPQGDLQTKPADTREQRLAQALRDNLRRRKAGAPPAPQGEAACEPPKEPS